MAKEITKKMRDFADEYLKTGNIYQSAIAAGYSENYAKGNARYLFENERVQKYIQSTLNQVRSEKIADIQEVMEYLTKGMRQELEEEVIVVEGVEQGVSEAVIKKKKIGCKDSIKCAELLGRRYGMWNDKVQVDVTVPMFNGEDDLK